MFGSLFLWCVVNENMFESFRIIYLFICVIFDCIEEKVLIFSQKVLNLQIYLNYKNYIIFKGFIGIIFCGIVLFISFVYNGWILDKEIIVRFGIFDLLYVFIYQ